MISQLSATDAAGPAASQTNQIAKAAVALNAFGTMCSQHNYSSIGRSRVEYMQSFATSNNHFLANYPKDSENENTWETTYNLWPDTLLSLNIFNASTLNAESAFYRKVRSNPGVAFDSDLDWARVDIQMWAAAAASKSTQSMFISGLHTYIAGGGSGDHPFNDQRHVNKEGLPQAYM